MPVMDALLAATGLQRNPSLVTQNAGDFSGANLNLINPWDKPAGQPLTFAS